jgi:cellulase/cellobiase CelA1
MKGTLKREEGAQLKDFKPIRSPVALVPQASLRARMMAPTRFSRGWVVQIVAVRVDADNPRAVDERERPDTSANQPLAQGRR